MAPSRALAIVGAALPPCAAALSWQAVEGLLSETGWDGGPEGIMISIALFVASWVLSALWLARASRRPIEDGLAAGLIVAAVMLAMVVPIVRGYGWFVLVPWAMFAGLALACSGIAGGVAGALQGQRPPLWVGIAALGAGLVMAMIASLFTPLGAELRMLIVVAFIWTLCAGVLAGGVWLVVRASRPLPVEA